ncbi:hypothetical protein [Massilia sp. Se16.2.3]|uniref:hypothetical protein n=1 Tax=Massilia sp. Se16.2.3 TaxID=2709303 RepID=UPI0016028866|nr:hypothetical protein [Massilia sp. Se16.2.3]QNB01143.1 hypothetical protein G4G31_23845 [Massilia sp. Se16.2.3]
MNRSHPLLAILAGAMSCAAVAADPGPLRQEMFVRGGFNGWGTTHPLRHRGGGVYQADVLVAPGNHGFKLGSADWGREWTAAAATPRAPVAAGATVPLATHAGPEATLFVRSTATYRFTLDASRPQRPRYASSAWPSPAARQPSTRMRAMRAWQRSATPPSTASARARAFRCWTPKPSCAPTCTRRP